MEIQLAAVPVPEDDSADDEVRHERAPESVRSTQWWDSGSLLWLQLDTGAQWL